MTNTPANETLIGFPSIRVADSNPLHHIWCNNGTWWVHYTLHFHGRKRRVRRSLGTSDVATAIGQRDELFARLGREGEPVPPRQHRLRTGEPELADMRTRRLFAFTSQPPQAA